MEVGKLRRDFCAFEHDLVNIFLPDYTSRLFTLKFHHSSQHIEVISGFGIYLCLMRRHVSSKTKVSKMVVGLEEIQTNAS